MADVNEGILEATNLATNRASQTGMPRHVTGTWTQDNTDNHDFHYDAAGKTNHSLLVDILTADETVTVTVYGAHAIDDDVGDTGVISLGSFTVTDAEDLDDVLVSDMYPFYIVRCVGAGAATGSPVGTVYIDSMA